MDLPISKGDDINYQVGDVPVTKNLGGKEGGYHTVVTSADIGGNRKTITLYYAQDLKDIPPEDIKQHIKQEIAKANDLFAAFSDELGKSQSVVIDKKLEEVKYKPSGKHECETLNEMELLNEAREARAKGKPGSNAKAEKIGKQVIVLRRIFQAASAVFPRTRPSSQELPVQQAQQQPVPQPKQTPKIHSAYADLPPHPEEVRAPVIYDTFIPGGEKAEEKVERDDERAVSPGSEKVEEKRSPGELMESFAEAMEKTEVFRKAKAKEAEAKIGIDEDDEWADSPVGEETEEEVDVPKPTRAPPEVPVIPVGIAPLPKRQLPPPLDPKLLIGPIVPYTGKLPPPTLPPLPSRPPLPPPPLPPLPPHT